MSEAEKKGQETGQETEEARKGAEATGQGQDQKGESRDRDEQGRFTRPDQGHNWKKMRESLAREVAGRKAAEDSLGQFRAEVSKQITDLRETILSLQGQVGRSPEERDEERKSRQWAERNVRPLVEPIYERFAREDAQRRQAEAEREATEQVNRDLYRWGRIRGMDEEQQNLVLSTAVNRNIRGEDNYDTFERVFEMLNLGKPKEGEQAQGETQRVADKRTATGWMGSTRPATEPNDDNFRRELQEARKNKDHQREAELFARRYAPMEKKFLAGREPPQT